MKFPHKDVTEPEMGLRRKAIAQAVAYWPAQTSLGKLITEGHKVWEWQIQESSGCLFVKIRTTSRFTDVSREGNTSASEKVCLVG